MRCRALVLLALIWAGISHAEIYRWVDENGQVHFGDQKPVNEPSSKVELELPPVYTEDINSQLERTEQAKAYVEQRKEQRAQQQAEKAAKNVREARDESVCLQARKQYDVVMQSIPVYIDENGLYRAAWGDDPYQGERQYIADADRASVVAQVKRQVDESCADPDNAAAQDAASRQQFQEEECEQEQAYLVALTAPNSRNSKGLIRRQQALVDSLCGPGSR